MAGFYQVPRWGESIISREGELEVPDNPIVPSIEGDGAGFNIWKASVGVFVDD